MLPGTVEKVTNVRLYAFLKEKGGADEYDATSVECTSLHM